VISPNGVRMSLNYAVRNNNEWLCILLIACDIYIRVYAFYCLDCQGELIVNNPLDVQENEKVVLDFALHMSHLFRSR
jgi:hypothetical protein